LIALFPKSHETRPGRTSAGAFFVGAAPPRGLNPEIVARWLRFFDRRALTIPANAIELI
jgi:hypothetical protein